MSGGPTSETADAGVADWRLLQRGRLPEGASGVCGSGRGSGGPRGIGQYVEAAGHAQCVTTLPVVVLHLRSCPVF